MAYQQRPNSGSLFKNDHKQPGDNKPDYKGSANIGGEDMEVAAWIKSGNKGKFMSLSFKPKQERRAQQEQPLRGIDPQDVPPATPEDDVPF